MNGILAKIGRENHLNHLIAVMPLITMVFGAQCYIMWKFSPGINIGDYAISMGLVLSFFIGMMVYYDNNHHILIYKDHLHIYFGLFGINHKIEFSNIQEIISPEEDVKFSSIIIKTKDKSNHVFYFVDYPLHVKLLIEEQIKQNKLSDEVEIDKAA